MARKRRPNEKSSYQPAPAMPAELAERYEVVAAVIAKTMSMSEGARRLGMARVNLQTLVNRTKRSMVESLKPRPSGPVPQPAQEAALRREVESLRRERDRLTEQLHTMDRLLGAAGEVIRDLRRPERGRRSPTSSLRSRQSSNDDDEDGPATCSARTTTTTAAVVTMRDPGASTKRRACALGVAGSTLRRWHRHGVPGARRRRRAAPPEEEARAIRAQVRELRGLPGAASLARSVKNVSRRQAAALKRAELTAMERERKASSSRVAVLAPAVIRGFDAVHVATTDGPRYLLASGDGHVPYRTHIAVVDRYDGSAVAAALDADFAASGAPLICRLDRARCHTAPEVLAVLHGRGVLVLHGPPYHPRYYGQLERQNREHRAWLEARGETYTPAELLADADRMKRLLNQMWRRPTLDWRTAECVWGERVDLAVDRDELRDAVTDGAARRERHGLDADLAWRLAVESALTDRGLLRITPKPEVLCEH